MRSILASAFLLAASAAAYQVITPNQSQSWVISSGNVSQPLTWQRVDTDPLNFTVVLTNQQNPSLMPPGVTTQVLAAQVDGTLMRTQLLPPSTGWKVGDGYRLNLCQDPQNLNTILAQSPIFSIVAANGTVSGSITLVNTPPATLATPAPLLPTAAAVPSSGTNPPASSGNGASANSLHPGLLALVMLLAFFAA